MSTSTIRRFGKADDAEADGVLAVVRWLDATPEDYVASDAVRGQRLSTSPGYIRVDMEVMAMAAGDVGVAKGRSRTTIQRVVEVAQHSCRPVASLTRLSDS